VDAGHQLSRPKQSGRRWLHLCVCFCWGHAFAWALSPSFHKKIMSAFVPLIILNHSDKLACSLFTNVWFASLSIFCWVNLFFTITRLILGVVTLFFTEAGVLVGRLGYSLECGCL
jgi:apolipoprotein N-acyltransferase